MRPIDRGEWIERKDRKKKDSHRSHYYYRKNFTRKPYRVHLRGVPYRDFRGEGLRKRCRSRGCRTVDLSRLRLNSNNACERRLLTTCARLTVDSALGISSCRLVSFFIPSFPASSYFSSVGSSNDPSSFSHHFLGSLPLSSYSLLLLRHPPPPDSPPPPERPAAPRSAER